MYLRRVIKEERCEVNGRLENIGFRIRGGDFIEIELDPTMQNSMRPENVPLDILFEDQHLVVVNKPAGMLVHPTNRDKNGTLLNALVFHLNSAIWDLGFGISDFGFERKVGYGAETLDQISGREGLRSARSSNRKL